MTREEFAKLVVEGHNFRGVLSAWDAQASALRDLLAAWDAFYATPEMRDGEWSPQRGHLLRTVAAARQVVES